MKLRCIIALMCALLFAPAYAQVTPGSLSPIVILAEGQSNFVDAGTFAWAPNPNARIWNNTVGTSGSVGTAYAAISRATVTLPQKLASDVADANPGHPVCLIVIAFNGQPISHWLVGTGAPDAYADSLSNVPAALTACGATKVNVFLWWQGEANTGPITQTYPANFETMIGRFRGNTWFPRETPVVIYSIASTAISGNSDGDNFNNVLLGLVATDPDNRKFVYTPSLPGATYWDVANPGHMTGQGYFSAGAMSAREYLSGVGRASNPGFIYQQETRNAVIGKPAYSSVPFLFNNNNALAPLGLTVTPGQLAQFIAADGQPGLNFIDTFGNFGNWICRRRNGTQAVPTGVVADDILCGLGGMGFDGTADTANKASLLLLGAELWTATHHGTYALFNLTVIGTDTNRTIRLDPGAISIDGVTSGTLKITAPAVAGANALALPSATDTLVGRATTDTLTNKTLTAPAINSPTGIVKGDVGLGNVANVDTTNAANISSGALPAARMPALTGDCTTSAGAVALTCTKVNGVDQTTAWTAYTPAVVGTGSTPTYTSGGRYRLVGKTCFVEIDVTYTGGMAGLTGSTISLPFTSANAAYIIGGRENAVSGKVMSGTINPSSAVLVPTNYDNTAPVTLNQRLIFTGLFEIP